MTDKLREAVARAISGAPFPSKASLKKADVAITFFRVYERYILLSDEVVERAASAIEQQMATDDNHPFDLAKAAISAALGEE